MTVCRSEQMVTGNRKQLNLNRKGAFVWPAPTAPGGRGARLGRRETKINAPNQAAELVRMTRPYGWAETLYLACCRH